MAKRSAFQAEDGGSNPPTCTPILGVAPPWVSLGPCPEFFRFDGFARHDSRTRGLGHLGVHAGAPCTRIGNQTHTQIQTLPLDLFASIAPMPAAPVITSTNPTHSAAPPILAPRNAAGLSVLLRIEFIAMMFLIIYVGAIAVLFPFVATMLNTKVDEPSEN